MKYVNINEDFALCIVGQLLGTTKILVGYYSKQSSSSDPGY